MHKNKLKRYNLWIDEISINELVELKRKEGISISAFIRISIREKLGKKFEKREKM